MNYSRKRALFTETWWFIIFPSEALWGKSKSIGNLPWFREVLWACIERNRGKTVGLFEINWKGTIIEENWNNTREIRYVSSFDL